MSTSSFSLLNLTFSRSPSCPPRLRAAAPASAPWPRRRTRLHPVPPRRPLPAPPSGTVVPPSSSPRAAAVLPRSRHRHPTVVAPSCRSAPAVPPPLLPSPSHPTPPLGPPPLPGLPSAANDDPRRHHRALPHPDSANPAPAHSTYPGTANPPIDDPLLDDLHDLV
eukprot:XP_020406452.1 vegetative cell wall protein gp1-like [Zea mays]